MTGDPLCDWVVAAVSGLTGLAPHAVAGCASLFDVPGFDSLTVVAIVDRIEAELGTEVPPEAIVPEAFGTVGALAALVSATLAASSRARAGGLP
jgi:phosphopantetheine binding protein